MRRDARRSAGLRTIRLAVQLGVWQVGPTKKPTAARAVVGGDWPMEFPVVTVLTSQPSPFRERIDHAAVRLQWERPHRYDLGIMGQGDGYHRLNRFWQETGELWTFMTVRHSADCRIVDAWQAHVKARNVKV